MLDLLSFFDIFFILEVNKPNFFFHDIIFFYIINLVYLCVFINLFYYV